MADITSLSSALGRDPYPGRGLILGLEAGGRFAVAAYFIMGRSANSRNRVFTAAGDDIEIRPWDAALVQDPSLIIYRPLRVLGTDLIVSNGDQTDTIYDGLNQGLSLADSLAGRCYEPDAPHYTPRISGLLRQEPSLSYELSILKREPDDSCLRCYYQYEPRPGRGHLLHTYAGHGEPLPSFSGEPLRVELAGDIDSLTGELWSALDEENRISLVVRYMDLNSGAYQQRLINKYI